MPDLTPSSAPIKAEGVGADSAVNATVAVPTDSHGGWGTAALKIATLPLQAVGFLTVKPFEMAYHHFFPVKDDLEYEDGCPMFSQIPTVSDMSLADAAYPPKEHPVQSLPVKAMIDANAKLIRDICYASKLNEYEYQKYLLPVITNLAHVVHLVPASQDDHHQGYGGLFTHSLEVAYYAANQAKNTIFDSASTPKEIQWNRRRWILICILAGLVHDIGKPYTDMEITTGSSTGGKSWRKSLPLLDWLRQEHVEEYYVSFLCDRVHNDHVAVALQKMSLVIPAETVAFINATGSGARMDKALRDALLYGKSQKGGLVGSILVEADGQSRQANKLLDRYVHPVHKNVSHPQGDPLLKAMRALVTNGVWKANGDAESEVFYTKQGCFINWNEKVAKSIWDKANSMGYQGLPGDYLKMAEILVDAQAAIPNVGDRGHILSTVWAVTPIMLKDQPVNCLKLRSYQYIYDSVAPTPVEAVIEGTPPDTETIKAWEEKWGCQPSPHIYLTEDEMPEKGFDEEYMQAEIESQQARAEEESEQLSAEAAAVDEYEREILQTEVGVAAEIPVVEHLPPTTAVSDAALEDFLPGHSSESHQEAEAKQDVAPSQEEPQTAKPFTKTPAFESTDVAIPEEERVGVRSPFKSKEERNQELAEANAKLELDRSKAPLSSNFKPVTAFQTTDKSGREKAPAAKPNNGIDITAFMPTGVTKAAASEQTTPAKDPNNLLGALPENPIVASAATEEPLMPNIETSAAPVSDDLMAAFLPGAAEVPTTEDVTTSAAVNGQEDVVPVAPQPTEETEGGEDSSQSHQDLQTGSEADSLFPDIDDPVSRTATKSEEPAPVKAPASASSMDSVTQPPEKRDTAARGEEPSILVKGQVPAAEEECLFPEVDAEAEIPPTEIPSVSEPSPVETPRVEKAEVHRTPLTEEETMPSEAVQAEEVLPPITVKEPTPSESPRGRSRGGKNRTGPKRAPKPAEALARAKAMVTELREQLKVGRGVWLPNGVKDERFGRTADYSMFEEAVLAERLDMFFISGVAAELKDGPQVTFDLKKRTATLCICN